MMLAGADLDRTAGYAAAAATLSLLLAGVTIALFFGGAGQQYGPMNDVFTAVTLVLLILPVLAIRALVGDAAGPLFDAVSLLAVVGLVGQRGRPDPAGRRRHRPEHVVRHRRGRDRAGARLGGRPGARLAARRRAPRRARVGDLRDARRSWLLTDGRGGRCRTRPGRPSALVSSRAVHLAGALAGGLAWTLLSRA